MITRQLWGKSQAGENVWLYTLTNAGGLSVQVTSYGARIVAVNTPDRSGAFANIIVGPDSLADFEDHGGFYGATIGRYANRIAGGSFELDGVTWQLNDTGRNTLHGGAGLHNLVWESADDGEQVVMTRLSADGTDGFPGNFTAVARFRLTDDDRLLLGLQAVADKPTICNLTNHAYWNLGGSLADCCLQIDAEQYLTVDEGLIPTGVAETAGTVFDFRSSRPIGTTLYDHQFVFSGAQPGAKLRDPATGRTLTLRADLPGMQLFTNPVRGSQPVVCNALCMEPQFNPDSPHHPEWPSVVLRPGELWAHEISLTFGVEP